MSASLAVESSFRFEFQVMPQNSAGFNSFDINTIFLPISKCFEVLITGETLFSMIG